MEKANMSKEIHDARTDSLYDELCEGVRQERNGELYNWKVYEMKC